MFQPDPVILADLESRCTSPKTGPWAKCNWSPAHGCLVIETLNLRREKWEVSFRLIENGQPRQIQWHDIDTLLLTFPGRREEIDTWYERMEAAIAAEQLSEFLEADEIAADKKILEDMSEQLFYQAERDRRRNPGEWCRGGHGQEKNFCPICNDKNRKSVALSDGTQMVVTDRRVVQ